MGDDDFAVPDPEAGCCAEDCRPHHTQVDHCLEALHWRQFAQRIDARVHDCAINGKHLTLHFSYLPGALLPDFRSICRTPGSHFRHQMAEPVVAGPASPGSYWLGGSRTLSMTWITPFDAAISALTT